VRSVPAVVECANCSRHACDSKGALSETVLCYVCCIRTVNERLWVVKVFVY